MIGIGTQYYRAPFPEDRYWEGDFQLMRQSGLNAVQLWVLWSWVEAKPGTFRFDDYDRLVELAERSDLEVVLSTIAAVHPHWIHQEIPGSEMIDNEGHRVVSSNRVECHFGLTPGGCLDHPEVWKRMAGFIEAVVKRYRTSPNLRGWDAWNELRWNVNADGYVCYCAYTIEAYRGWLKKKYGGIEGLNDAWKRRYNSFSEVYPGKLPPRPYTDMMAFQHFLTCRANEHARKRYELIKKLDPDRPVTVHGARPSILHPGGQETFDTALNRGNDWALSDCVDGIGFSSFPKWYGMDDADFAVRIRCGQSAAQTKRLWLSELQGGRGCKAFEMSAPVNALSQQRWLWNGIAAGADTILFWCWRDEVFGQESSGYGIVGSDGLVEERLRGFRETCSILSRNEELFDRYTPEEVEVGILFSPQSYYLFWSQEGSANKAMHALEGYAKALVRRSIPFTFVEEEHLDGIDGLKILFLPRAVALDDSVTERLGDFVRSGGVIVCESECGAFDASGFYRYPEDRFLTALTGVAEKGRRSLEGQNIEVTLDREKLVLGVSQWLTPFESGTGEVLSECREGALITDVPVGAGRAVLCGSYLGEAYRESLNPDFETFLEQLIGQVCEPDIRIVSPRPTDKHFVHVSTGTSAKRRIVFVYFQKDYNEATILFRNGFLKSSTMRDIVTDSEISVERANEETRIIVPTNDLGIAVLVGK